MKILDLFCGVGGASMGMSFALKKEEIPFSITGIDIAPQPEYPFIFIQDDATKLDSGFLKKFDFIWASPPCQCFSVVTKPFPNIRAKYRDCLNETRSMLEKSGKLYCIENVPTAPLKKNIFLCGTMFNLKVLRHRIFETNFALCQPTHVRHVGTVINREFVTVAGNGADGSSKISNWQNAMGICWTRNRRSLAEAVPPAYSEYIVNGLIGKDYGQRQFF